MKKVKKMALGGSSLGLFGGAATKGGRGFRPTQAKTLPNRAMQVSPQTTQQIAAPTRLGQSLGGLGAGSQAALKQFVPGMQNASLGNVSGLQKVKSGLKSIMKKGGAVKSASSRADGIAQKGKTKGRMV
jgi:hypothetical protein